MVYVVITTICWYIKPITKESLFIPFANLHLIFNMQNSTYTYLTDEVEFVENAWKGHLAEQQGVTYINITSYVFMIR